MQGCGNKDSVHSRSSRYMASYCLFVFWKIPCILKDHWQDRKTEHFFFIYITGQNVFNLSLQISVRTLTG